MIRENAQILTVDIGTGTQDVFLFDSRLDVENGYKLIVPAPTMIVHRRIRQATQHGVDVLLTGVLMGGGPSAWAADAHLRAGHKVYATPDAARSFNDDLEAVRALGVCVISEDEALRLPGDVERIELRDFDFDTLQAAFQRFGVGLDHLAGVAVGVFDHGDAPPQVSDRQFRFDYLDATIRLARRKAGEAYLAGGLSAFAYLSDHIPPIMTRLRAVARSASGVDAPLVVMDTAPAAVLGATFDPVIRQCERVMVANVGNFHTLAFRLGEQGVEGVFEHHTGMLDCAAMDDLLRALADGSLTHGRVYDGHGHGALVYGEQPLQLDVGEFGVAVTGPRRNLMKNSKLRPYFAAPFGDMMITGCFGLLAGVAARLPELREVIMQSLLHPGSGSTAPWDE